MSGTIKLVGQDTSSPAVPLPGAGESLPMIPPDLQPESGHATTYVEGVSPSAPDTGEAPLPPVARPISVAIVARAEAIIMRGGYVRDKKEQWSAFLISLGNEVPSGEIPHVILALLKCLESEQVGMLVSEEDNFIYQAAIWTGLGKNLTESCYALGHDLIMPCARRCLLYLARHRVSPI